MQDYLATFPFLILRHRKIFSRYMYIYISIINNVQFSFSNLAFSLHTLLSSGYLDVIQNKDYGTWRVIYSGVAFTRCGLSTISSIVGTKYNGKGHFELIAVNCFFAKCNLGGSANEHF